MRIRLHFIYHRPMRQISDLRRKVGNELPDAPRPYRTWGYPIVPIVFLIVNAWLIITTIWSTPKQSAIGLGLILIGLPVYLIWSKRDRSANEE